MAVIGGGSFDFERLQDMRDMSRFVPPGGFAPQAPVEGVQPTTHEKVEETDEARQASISDSLMRPTDSVSLSSASSSENGSTPQVGELSSKDMMAQLRATGLNVQGSFGGWS